MALIVPTVLETDLAAFAKTAQALAEFAPVMQFDIADGNLVPNKTIDAKPVFDFVRAHPAIQVELHAMVADAENILEKAIGQKLFAAIVHIEALGPKLNSAWLKKWQRKLVPTILGLAINPETSVDSPPAELKIWDEVDFLTVMTVNPGRQGNPFLAAPLQKIPALCRQGYSGTIEVDGGVNQNTLAEILLIAPDRLVVGSAVTRATNPKAAYQKLKELA